MKNMIVMFYGAAADVPPGWHICDGTHGTPDLTALFVRGSPSDGLIGATGGANYHTHTADQPPHAHGISTGTAIASGTGKLDYTTSTDPTITVELASNEPPYMFLYYIMKL